MEQTVNDDLIAMLIITVGALVLALIAMCYMVFWLVTRDQEHATKGLAEYGGQVAGAVGEAISTSIAASYPQPVERPVDNPPIPGNWQGRGSWMDESTAPLDADWTDPTDATINSQRTEVAMLSEGAGWGGPFGVQGLDIDPDIAASFDAAFGAVTEDGR